MNAILNLLLTLFVKLANPRFNLSKYLSFGGVTILHWFFNAKWNIPDMSLLTVVHFTFVSNLNEIYSCIFVLEMIFGRFNKLIYAL